MAKILLTCVLTVASLTNSPLAISRFVCPAAISVSTSASRGVRSAPARFRAPCVDRLWRTSRGGQQLLLNPWVEHGLDRRSGYHGPPDFPARGVFGEITKRSGLQGANHVFSR